MTTTDSIASHSTVEFDARDKNGPVAFLARQIESLGELDFVGLIPLAAPLNSIEVSRLDDTATGSGQFAVRIPLRPPDKPLPPTVREQLDRCGYLAADTSVSLGERLFDHPDDAAAAAEKLLWEVFECGPKDQFDLRHGSRRQRRDADRKLLELRARIETALADMLGRLPEVDGDGDYLVPHLGLTILIAPRAAPGGVPLVRVATITNLGITLTPEVGALLANLNFGIAFGRFVLDSEHRAIWFDETLLGDDLRLESLSLTIEVVARTAADWIDRFRQLFGGTTQSQAGGKAEAVSDQRKPGQGGYL